MAQWRTMSMRFPASVSVRTRALVALHVAVLLFGFAGLFGKWLALPAVTIVFGRCAVAAVALALLLPLAGDGAARGRLEWKLVASGVLLALHWVAFFRAIQTASVAVGLLGFASFPLFVLLLEALLRQRPLRGREWLTAALVSGGLLLVAPEWRWENRVMQGLLWGIVSGLTFALLAVANRTLATRHAAGAIALWQTACAADLPAAAPGTRSGAPGCARPAAAARARRGVHRARAYAVRAQPARAVRAHGERRHRVRAGIRHRTGFPFAR